MTVAAIIGVLLWFVLVMIGGTLAIACLYRKGARGAPWALLAVGGALLAFPIFYPPARYWMPQSIWIAVGGLVAMPIACLGLVIRPPRTDRCPNCHYDFRGVTNASTLRCPECGMPRPGTERRCLACKADISNALAGGTIKCPFCGAPIEREQGRA